MPTIDAPHDSSGGSNAKVAPEGPSELETPTPNEDWDHRYAIAINPSTPSITLHSLAADSDHDVRLAVARNPNTSPQTLELLANDSSLTMAIEANPNTPPDLLDLISEDPYPPSPQLETRNSPTTPQAEAAHDGSRHDQAATTQGAAPPEVSRLASSPDAMLRVDAANHPQVTVSVLERLATDQVGRVRAAVAWNPLTPIGVLEKLVTDPDPGVRICLLPNASLPKRLLIQLEKDTNRNIREEARRRGAPKTRSESIGPEVFLWAYLAILLAPAAWAATRASGGDHWWLVIAAPCAYLAVVAVAGFIRPPALGRTLIVAAALACVWLPLSSA